MKILIMTLLISLTTPLLYGQNKEKPTQEDNNRHFVLDFSYDYGQILNSNPFLNGDNLAKEKIDTYSGFTLKFGIQNPGYALWQHTYKFPYYGIGLSYYNLKSKEIGNPISSFAYFGYPLWRYKKLEIYGEFQFGFAGNWNKYDSISNPKNISVSTNFTAYTGGGLRAFINLRNHLDLGYGINFKHFSNGGGSLPNKGINFHGSEVTVRYNIQKRPNYHQIKVKENPKKKNELVVFINFGQYQTIDKDDQKHDNTVLGISTLFYWQHTRKYRNGLGIDINNWMEKLQNSGNNTIQNYLSLGFVFQPEISIGNLDLIGGIGCYARHQSYTPFKQLYQRLGMRYNINNKISLGFNIRAIDFYVAENIEYQFGYHF